MRGIIQGLVLVAVALGIVTTAMSQGRGPTYVAIAVDTDAVPGEPKGEGKRSYGALQQGSEANVELYPQMREQYAQFQAMRDGKYADLAEPKPDFSVPKGATKFEREQHEKDLELIKYAQTGVSSLYDANHVLVTPDNLYNKSLPGEGLAKAVPSSLAGAPDAKPEPEHEAKHEK
jgi:hypothetical protein